MNAHIFLWLGLIVLGAAWIGPIPTLTQKYFFGHMIMHMLVVVVASPLLGIYFVMSKKVKASFMYWAIPASIVELAIVWSWHAPRLHHFARHTTLGLMLEQGTFLLSGVWVWFAALGGPRGAGIIGLLLTSMHMTFLGGLLSFSNRGFYPHHHGTHHLDILTDQHIGGGIMLVVGGVSYLLGGLWLTLQLVKEDNFIKSGMNFEKN